MKHGTGSARVNCKSGWVWRSGPVGAHNMCRDPGQDIHKRNEQARRRRISHQNRRASCGFTCNILFPLSLIFRLVVARQLHPKCSSKPDICFYSCWHAPIAFTWSSRPFVLPGFAGHNDARGTPISMLLVDSNRRQKQRISSLFWFTWTLGLLLAFFTAPPLPFACPSLCLCAMAS